MLEQSLTQVALASWAPAHDSTEDLLSAMAAVGCDLAILDLDAIVDSPAWTHAAERLLQAGMLLPAGRFTLPAGSGEDFHARRLPLLFSSLRNLGTPYVIVDAPVAELASLAQLAAVMEKRKNTALLLTRTVEASDLVQMLHEIESPALRLCPDVAALTAMARNTPPAELLESLLPYSDAILVSDIAADGSFTGSTPWPELIRTLAANDFQGPVIIAPEAAKGMEPAAIARAVGALGLA